MVNARPAPIETLDVGDIRVTFVPDGDCVMTAQTIFPSGNDVLWNAHRELFDESGRMFFTLGAFLIETSEQKVLVDLGFGPREAEFPSVDGVFRGGKLLDNLASVRVSPEDIDVVFYTHLHLDHVGWTSQNGQLTFPNARHVVGAGELEFWQGVTDEALLGVGPDPESVQAPLRGRIESAGDGEIIAPGVNVLASPGHTPGHCSAVISSGTDRAIILGDVVHCPLQITDPDLRIIFDVDPDTAVATRDRISAEAAGDSSFVAEGHFSGSVFGRVVPAEGRKWFDLGSAPAAR